MEQQDILLDIEKDIYLEKASRGARFADYFVDGIIINVVERFGSYFFSLFFMTRSVASEEYRQLRENLFQTFLVAFSTSYLTSCVFIFIYYTLMEGSTQGRTLGKLVTGTQAVRNDGAPVTWKDACLRSLCRLIPFEAFSGFGTPWHDRLTNTQVVKVQK